MEKETGSVDRWAGGFCGGPQEGRIMSCMHATKRPYSYQAGRRHGDASPHG